MNTFNSNRTLTNGTKKKKTRKIRIVELDQSSIRTQLNAVQREREKTNVENIVRCSINGSLDTDW